MLDLAPIISEIEAGLPNEQERLDQSRANILFYRGEFDQYLNTVKTNPGKLRKNHYPDPDHDRPVLFAQWAVNTLGKLYSIGPAREITDNPALTKWLDDLYAREDVNGSLQEADRLAIAGDVTAIQVVATGDPDRPIRLQVWPAHQFVAWDSEDDPANPAAVATIDFFDGQRRLRLYTPDHEITYRTKKTGASNTATLTAGGTYYYLESTVPNPFGLLPFAFVHACPPTTEFWTHGPGDLLQVANEYLNHDLTDLGGSIKFLRRPVVKAFGAENNPPDQIYPGLIWHVQPSAQDEAGNGIAPQVDYLQPDGSFVEVTWADIQGYVDLALQTVNIPPATFRMVQTDAASGVAIVAEQLPVLQATEAKQRPFLAYERRLARVVLAVGGHDPTEADRLTLRWPEIVPRSLLYGAQEDQADQADLDLGLTSRIMIAMRRLNLNREAAIAHLKQVAKDREEEETIGLPPIPTKQPQPVHTDQEDPNADRSEVGNDPGQGARGTPGRSEPEE